MEVCFCLEASQTGGSDRPSFRLGVTGGPPDEDATAL
jgi:hypothetical protein